MSSGGSRATGTSAVVDQDDEDGRTTLLKGDVDIRKAFNFPLVRYTDMGEDMRAEVVDLCVTAGEKYAENVMAMAQMIKVALDGKYGPAWHVVIGEGYGFEVTHDTEGVLHMYFAGRLGMLVWKCEPDS